MPDIVIIAAHPHLQHSRITKALIKAAGGVGPQVVLRELYGLYPDYLIDVPAEQAALSSARLVVWLHPIHWYSMPPLMKLWLDEVLAFGWAYGPGGRALQGKDFWLVTSTGGGLEAYAPEGHHQHPFETFLAPYRQTAALTGMCMQDTLVLHAAHRADPGTLAAHTARFAGGLASYLRGEGAGSASPAANCRVPQDERPLQPEETVLLRP